MPLIRNLAASSRDVGGGRTQNSYTKAAAPDAIEHAATSPQAPGTHPTMVSSRNERIGLEI